jgi:hypothetical protein
VDNIKIDLEDVGWGGLTGLVRLKTGEWRVLVNVVMNLRFASSDGKFL